MITTKLKNNKKLVFSIIFALVMVCSFIKLCDLIVLLLSEERGIFICSIAFLVEVIVYSIFSIIIVNKTNTLEKQETSLLFNRLLTSALIGFAFFSTPLISQLSQLPVPCTVQPEFNLLLALLAAFTVVSFWGGSYIYTDVQPKS